MDFLDPKKKRAHKIRLYLGYALVAFALTIGSAVLFFEARGFDRDWKTGEIIQNGVVYVDAHPEQATVYVNGKEEARTDARLALPAGDYTFEYTRQGYRTWKRAFKLIGSQLERLNYAFMFPEKLETKEIRSYTSAPGFATQSLDRKWLITQRIGALTTFDVMDLGATNNPVTTLTLPVGLLNTTAGADKLELIEWSTDNRRVLVQHTFTGGSEFVLVDREQPAESINLNRHFNIPIYKVALRDKKFDELHILDKPGGTLRFGDSKSKQLTDVAAQVFSFKSYGDDVIFYVSSDESKAGMVNARVIKGRDKFNVRELPISTKYPIDITRYDDEWYLAVGTDVDKKAYIFHEVFEDFKDAPAFQPEPNAVFRMNKLDFISVSANTRFIAVQGGSEFAVYDAEHDRRYQYDTKLPLAPGQETKWMDGHRLAVASQEKLVVWEYDGINMQTLTAAHPTFIPFFDRDYDFLYTIGPSATAAGQSAITKTPMRTQADL